METKRKKLSLDELMETPEYQQLTPKQKLFVATYCGGGLVDGVYDPVVATMTAYKCRSMEVARVMSYALMGNIKIIEVLNRHFNTEPIDQFLKEVNRAIRNKHLTQAQIQALRLKADLLGFSARLPGADHMGIGRISPDVEAAAVEAGKQTAKALTKAARRAKSKRLPRASSAAQPTPQYGF